MMQYLFRKHTAPQILKIFGGKEWQGQIMYNHGENNGRGTVIAFNPKLNPIVHNTIVDDQGRSIILDCIFFSVPHYTSKYLWT